MRLLMNQIKLEDDWVVVLPFSAFVRHGRTIKMSNIAQIVNVIAQILTTPEGRSFSQYFIRLSFTAGSVAILRSIVSRKEVRSLSVSRPLCKLWMYLPHLIRPRSLTMLSP